MIFKNKFYKSCLLLTTSIAMSSFASLIVVKNGNNNNIAKSDVHSFRSSNISGDISTIDKYDHVEVNLSGYDIDLDNYIVNVDQTSETGIPLNNGFQIYFEIVSKNKFKISRTSLRKYYRLYILDKTSKNPREDKQYFRTVIKVDNFGNNGSTTDKKIYSSIEILKSTDNNGVSNIKSFFIEKGFFRKETGFDRNLLNQMEKWDMEKVYDEMNGKIFNVSNKNTFVNEVKQIGYDLEYKKDLEIERLSFWIILKEQYIFNSNYLSDFLVVEDFQIERDLPPPIQSENQNQQNSSSFSSSEKTIFLASSITILLFIIAMILFITISHKNKNKLKRNHDLEKAIKNRSK